MIGRIFIRFLIAVLCVMAGILAASLIGAGIVLLVQALMYHTGLAIIIAVCVAMVVVKPVADMPRSRHEPFVRHILGISNSQKVSGPSKRRDNAVGRGPAFFKFPGSK